jgi:diguanylate cyclase (GGDEF)-like protein/PAS domain S-box-containing protein
MKLLRHVRSWFRLGNADTPIGRALLVEQFRTLSRQIPLLYGVLIIDSASIAYVLPETLPWTLRFGIPAPLLLVSAIRLTRWLWLRTAALPPAAALAYLFRASILVSALSVAFTTWTLTVFETLDTAARAPLALLAFMGAIGSAYCLTSFPAAARLTLLLSALPITLRLLVTGEPLLVCIGINLGLLLVLLVRMMNTSFRDLVKLVSSRTKILAERERARRAEAAARTEQAKAAAIAARFDTALNNMSQGVCFFDAEERLLVCNRRYLDMYNLPPGSVRPGMRFGEIIEQFFAAGSFPAMSPDDYLDWRRRIATAEQPLDTILELTNGRVMRICHRPMPGHGWVATHEDITESHRAAEALAEAKAAAERAEHAARAAHTTLVDALDLVPEGLAIFDAEDRLVLCNRRYTDLYAESREAITPGTTFEEMVRARLRRGHYPDARGREEQWVSERLARHAQPHSMHEQPLLGDRWIRIEERRTADGGSIGMRVDITDLKRSEASFRLLFEENPFPMWVVDVETLELLAVNAATCRHYGYTREQMLTMTVEDLRVPDETAQLRAEFRAHKGTQTGGATRRHITADGRVIDIAIEARPLSYNGRDACVAAAFDMTERKRAEQHVIHLARHDPLTDLPNRIGLDEHFGRVLADVQARGGQFAVLCIDLDRFKEINDLCGHSTGDIALREVSRRLREAAQGACDTQGAFLARVGGDEFIAITQAEPQPATAELLATRLQSALKQDIEVDGHVLELGVSIGIAVYPRDGADSRALFANADAALYRAKHDGRGAIRFFTAAMDQQLRDRRALERDLRAAIENGELSLAYQPQRHRDGRLIGFEALVRWRHPQRGLVPPADFIPIAEESGQIIEIGEWVLREACREAASWPGSLTLAVNISAVQFRRGDLQQTVQRVLRECGIAPTRLELEITEGVLIENVARTAAMLRGLKALGVRIALDDFGTGYSSLSYLQSFPLDLIKIDRTFVSNLGEAENSLAIVRAVIGLAHGLGLPVLAEGVETAAQLALLSTEGCDNMQGYFIGYPQPIAAYADIIDGADDAGCVRRVAP